jgi:hypothetical protein
VTLRVLALVLVTTLLIPEAPLAAQDSLAVRAECNDDDADWGGAMIVVKK